MFELITVVLFLWLMLKVIGMALKLTWGAAKIVVSILLGLAFPMLIGGLLFAGGIALLVPVVLVSAAFGILKACV